jgi:hypothetical protein
VKKKLKKGIHFLLVFSTIELASYLFLSSRSTDAFNFGFFFFVWAFLALIIPLALFFGVESRGNFLAMGRVYDHNNVNTMDQMAPKAPQTQPGPLLALLGAYLAPFMVNLTLYFLVA